MQFEQEYTCPHCWQVNTLLLDTSVSGPTSFVQDCEVCCNPIEFRYEVRDGAVDLFDARELGQ